MDQRRARPTGPGADVDQGLRVSRKFRERLEVLYGPRGVRTAQPRDPGFTVILRLPLSGVASQAAA